MPQHLITVGHSPDPDDAFMFYALAHNKLDTGNLRFRHELQDIETLNRRALRGELHEHVRSQHELLRVPFEKAVRLKPREEFLAHQKVC